MSADDTILVIGIWINSKKYYIVLHVQAAENFEDYAWFLWYIEDRFQTIKYTTNKSNALRIASKMDEKWKSEYGIKEKDYFDQVGIAHYKDILQLSREQYAAIDAINAQYAALSA